MNDTLEESILGLILTIEMLIATLDPVTRVGEKHIREALLYCKVLKGKVDLRESRLDYSADLGFVPWTAALYSAWLSACALSAGAEALVIPRIGARGWRVDEASCERCSEFFDRFTRGHSSWHCPVELGITFFIGSESLDYDVFANEDDDEDFPRQEIHVAANQVRNELRRLLND